ncbi:hypothetical protein [Flavobacterium sp. MK4S-17]|uniref:DUF7010 family protein n=1 Tax=Flavobacterium sp. MK4S-17 TaxID=2543737 RepID=UPI001F432376|nr:hypothetical protein [Flavobacterium sp. MK4S-17]
MITEKELENLRVQLSVKSKNGLDFILSAFFIWLIISCIWTLDFSSFDKSILTFIAGSLMLPLAFAASKLLKTKWTDKSNPLQPLGLWLNFAQLFYFPFLIFALLKMPDNFVMVYVIITGAHFFPYAWFYKTQWFAIFAGIISFGALILGLNLEPEKMYFLPVFMSICLLVLAILLHFDSRKKRNIIN